MSQKFRLVTRSDFDGLVCAVLLKEKDMIDDILFAHPKDVQDGSLELGSGDITTNLPYNPAVHLCFDHHESEETRVTGDKQNCVIEADCPSAASVVYKYYGGAEGYPNIDKSLMEAVDKADSAQFTKEEILDPSSWVLLSFLMDARTGLGRFREFSISNYQLMMKCIELCRQQGVEEILQDSDVKERVDLYFEQVKKHKEQILRCTRMDGSVAVLDLRNEEMIYAGNRFTIYALFPEAKVSVHVMWGRQKQNTVLACGKSILDRSSKANLGDICLKRQGGGHAGAATCQVDNQGADEILAELVKEINQES